MFTIFILLASLTTPLSYSKILDRVYAVVNDQIITESDISDYSNSLKNNKFINDILYFDPNDRKNALANKDILLKKIIDEKIIESQVKKNGISVTPEEVNSEIEGVIKSRGITKTDLVNALKKEKKSFVEYQDFIKKSLERKHLIAKEIQGKIKISDEDVVAFYIAKKGKDSSQIYEYDLEQMTFYVKSQDSVQQASTKAQKALAKLKSNEDFKAVAIELSDDGTNIDFGKFKAGELRPEIEKSVNSLRVGDHTDIVQTPIGFQIFKMKKKNIINDPELARLKPQIQQVLLQNAYKDHLEYWLSQQRASANIRINEKKP